MSEAQIWTIAQVLDWTRGFFERKGFSTPRLDAELLICHALDVERISLYLQHHKPLSPGELSNIRALVKRRSTHEPIHYILGYREFWSLRLEVDPRVLIPRPDTEMLVEVALKMFEHEPKRVLDLCCGSGAVGLAIAKERPHSTVLGTDISSGAIEVALANRAAHTLENIEFLESDLFDQIDSVFDVIVCNPPYIRADEMEHLMSDVVNFEPLDALNGGLDGLDFYRRILAAAPAALSDSGVILFAIGYDQAKDLADLIADHHSFDWVGCTQDLGGRDRVVCARHSTSKSSVLN